MKFQVIGRWQGDGSAVWYVDANSEQEALHIAREQYPEPEYEWEFAWRFPEEIYEEDKK